LGGALAPRYWVVRQLRDIYVGDGFSLNILKQILDIQRMLFRLYQATHYFVGVESLVNLAVL
jgi:hypothetical protein